MLKKIFISLVLLALLGAFTVWYIAFKPNIKRSSPPWTYLYVHTGTTFDEFYEYLVQKNLLRNPKTFLITAKLKRFKKPRPGRYLILRNYSNNQIINKIRSGIQEPINLVIPSLRTKEQLAGWVARDLEPTKGEILHYLNDDNFLKQFGFSSQDVLAMFIPNTYQFYWNTSASAFVKRMYREYKRFWTPERLKKAKQTGLTPKQVVILASIVQAEQMSHPDEWPRIAGLYINRLKRHIPLQSDPTLIYAWGDFSKKRVYNYMKKINSPYNTYKYAGLPPGPILNPEPSAIDAVLNYEHNDYLYMVARADFSGYHHFSKTLSEHLKYARLYQQALNKRGIH